MTTLYLLTAEHRTLNGITGTNRHFEPNIILFSIQHRGVLGERMDHAVKVVAVELRQDPGLVMELDLAPDHLARGLAVIMAHAVGLFCKLYVLIVIIF